MRFFMNANLNSFSENLIDRWYDAAAHNTNTTKLMILNEDTSKLLSDLNTLSQSPETKEKMKKVSEVIRKSFDKHSIGETEQLIQLIVKNTTDETTGAYMLFHKLFSLVSEAKDSDVIMDFFDDPNLTINYINQSAFAYLDKDKAHTLHIGQPDVENLVLSQLSPKDLSALNSTSKKEQEFVQIP